MDYRSAGVDIEAGRAFVERIRSSVNSTRRPEVVGDLGGFGGFCRLPAGLRHPLLVAGTDGVGTKLELAQEHGGHTAVGVDLVAMCVNDVITSGAEPLFFLDYMATGRLQGEAMAEVLEGIAAGCRRSGCALLGGETAEMPGFYPAGRYDLAGFCVGVVEEEERIDGRRIRPGHRILALASSGVHSNGFSLVRRILDRAGVDGTTRFGAEAELLIPALLEPTTLYASPVAALRRSAVPVHGMAHVTGGGLPENLPRCLPAGLAARVDPAGWRRPELFTWLQRAGDIPERDLWHTFNLGVGFCLVVPADAEAAALAICRDHDLAAWVLGEVVAAPSEGERILGLPA
jgi:phosphoribosylformylglycinamidine cyclo-ligase